MSNHYLRALASIVAGLILLLGPAVPSHAQQEIVIGVLVEDVIAVEQQRWDVLAEHLTRAEPDWQVSVRAMSLDEIEVATKYHQLHFVLTDPAHFTRLQRQATYTKAIATLVRRAGSEPVPALAGTIVVSASRQDLTNIASLSGKRMAVHSKGLLSGFQAQLDTLQRKGVPADQAHSFVETGGGAISPLIAVQHDRADAAFVRAGMLEELVSRGELPLSDYRVLEPQHMPGFPFAVSTRLYPDWPMVALVPASPELARKLAAHLLAINPTSTLAEKLGIYGFDVPANYVIVTEMARKLRLPPFDVSPEFTFADIWSQYRAWVVSLAIAAAVIFMMLAGMLVQNRNITSAQAAALLSAQALERSEAMLRSTLEQAPYVAVQWFDHEGRVSYWNKASENLYGWSASEALGQRTDELFQTSVQARELQGMIKALACGELPAEVKEYTFATKAKNPVKVLSTIFISSSGKDDICVKMDVDITSMRKAEQALDEERALTRAVMQALPDMVWLKDVSGTYLQCNDRLGKFFGQAPEAIVGKTDYDFCNRTQADLHTSSDREVITSGKRLVYDRVYTFASDGHKETVEVTKTPLRDESGGLLGVIGVAHDVTASRAARAALEESQQRYRALVETTHDWIWEVDVQGRFTYSSPTVWDLLEYSANHVVGVPQYKLVAEVDRERIRELLEDHSDEPRPFKNVEAVFQHREGRQVVMELSAVPILDEAGVFRGYRGITRDVSVRKASEDALRQSQEHLEELVSERTADLEAARIEAERLLQVKSDFLANMSHEIRTPLNAVLGLAQLGASDSEGIPEKARINYKRILDSGQHLLGLINDILDFSKADVGKLMLESTPFALSECIDRAVNFIAARAHAQGLNLVVLEDETLPETVTGDITRLTQIMTNLLGNAVKFTNKGAVGFSICREERELVFRVTDTGIGMTDEQQAALFRPFEQANTSTTREYGGTGLGMAISKRLVDEMNGKIIVNSWIDIGTTVEVRIPIQEDEIVERDARQGHPSIRLAGFEPEDQDNLATVLQASGYKVDVSDLAHAYAGLGEDAALLVGEHAFADSSFADDARAHLDHPFQLQVLRSPLAKASVPSDLDGKVVLLDWPLRARHLVCVFNGDAEQSRDEKQRCGRLPGLSILAAEDNDINRIVLEDLLHKEKATVRFAENGQMLLDIINEEGRDKFDLVLMDIQMPVMDGHTATRRLLADHPDIPVIGLTAHALAEERERSLAAGMVEHVTKPIAIDTLMAAILRHVDVRPEAVVDTAPSAVTTDDAHVSAGDAAHEPDDSGLIDWQALNERFDHRTAFINKVLGAIYESHAASPENLQRFVEARDFEKLAFLAHSLKGTAGNMMSGRLFELAKQTETLARAEDGAAWEVTAELSTVLDKVMGLLKQHLKVA